MVLGYKNKEQEIANFKTKLKLLLLLTYSLATRRSLTIHTDLCGTLDEFYDVPFEEEESSEDEEGIEEMAGINAEQFAALLAAARGPVQPAVVAGGTKKLTTLESTSGQDWRTWRSTFGTVVNINAWGDLRQRRELKAAMAGEANRLTADIEIDPPGIGCWASRRAGPN